MLSIQGLVYSFWLGVILFTPQLVELVVSMRP